MQIKSKVQYNKMKRKAVGQPQPANLQYNKIKRKPVGLPQPAAKGAATAAIVQYNITWP